MEQNKKLALILLQYLAITACSIGVVKGIGFGNWFNLDPVKVHKKCLRHFVDLEEARRTKDVEMEIESAKAYWECHYENLG